MELWGAGELHDEVGPAGASAMFGAMTAVLVALAAFFVAFGPIV